MRPSALMASACLVLLGCQFAFAWGPFTERYVCHEAVKYVWGVEASASCLPLRDKASLDEFCDTVSDEMGSVPGDNCRLAALNGSEIHPSLASYHLFKDEENRHDFSRCPLNQGNNRIWACGDGSSPALKMYERWMKAAETAPSLCVRIYDFCVAGQYFADAQSSLHQLKFVPKDCVDNIEASIDRCLEAGLSDCSSSQLCKFDNTAKGMGNLNNKEKLGESSSTLSLIIADLAGKGMQLKALPYKPHKGVVVFSNSQDAKASVALIEYLTSAGVNAIPSDAAGFDGLKYNNRLIIVGGQNSPEGIGAIATSVLSTEAKESLLQPNYEAVFVTDGPWTVGQKVIVLAGNEAKDTEKSCSDNRGRVLEEVRP